MMLWVYDVQDLKEPQHSTLSETTNCRLCLDESELCELHHQKRGRSNATSFRYEVETFTVLVCWLSHWTNQESKTSLIADDPGSKRTLSEEQSKSQRHSDRLKVTVKYTSASQHQLEWIQLLLSNWKLPSCAMLIAMLVACQCPHFHTPSVPRLNDAMEASMKKNAARYEHSQNWQEVKPWPFRRFNVCYSATRN